MEDPNDMWFWFPKLVTTGAAVPRTKMIRTEVDFSTLMDGVRPGGFDKFIERLRAAGDVVGWPLFLRTGHTSGKHEWKRTCFVESADQLPARVSALVEYSEMAGFIGLPTDTWVVREFLQLESSFKTNKGMPVNRERRFFIDGGRVLCHHPYWPADAVAQLVRTPEAFRGQLHVAPRYTYNPPDWEEKLAELNEIDVIELAWLENQCSVVSANFDGAWSIDWAKTAEGQWKCIDMATAERSFHWPGCEIAGKRGWGK